MTIKEPSSTQQVRHSIVDKHSHFYYSTFKLTIIDKNLSLTFKRFTFDSTA